MKLTTTMHCKATVSSKGQLVIPRKLREILGIHAGLELLLSIRKDGVMEIKPVERSIDMFFGSCKRSNESSMSISEMDDAIEKAVMSNESQHD